jgi:DNA-binding Lrp family transcriptional regulator
MARDLGVDQSTVRARIRRFQDSGALKGWYLGTNPGNYGLHVGQVWLGVKESDKIRVIDSLLSSRQVERVCNYFGPTLSFVFLFRGGTDSKPVLAKIVERSGPGVTVLGRGIIPVPSLPLKDLDVSIIRSLQNDPWKSYRRVAKEVRASSRTITRRVAKMSEMGAIYSLPVVDLKALQGVIPAEFMVEYASDGSRRHATTRIVSRLRNNLVFSDVKGPRGYFAVLVENLSQLDQLAEWSRKEEGVRGIQVGALQDVILNTKHYHNRLA